MDLLPSGGFALGPGRIVIDDGLDRALPLTLSGYGPRVGLVVGGVGHRLLAGELRTAGVAWPPPGAITVPVPGAVTAELVADTAAQLGWTGEPGTAAVDVIVGGGKVLDVAKATGDLATVPVVTVPTSAATCACAATLSVLYTPSGGYATARQVATVRELLIPRRIVSAAPERLLVAGAFDAMAKYLELQWQLQERWGATDALPWPAQLAAGVAEQIHHQIAERLRGAAPGGLAADDVLILANTVGAALVTGTQPPTRTGVAHAMYYMHRNRVAEPQLLHGEVVGTGLLVQLILNDAPDQQLLAFRELLQRYGLPTVLDARITGPDGVDDAFLAGWAGYCDADPAALAAAVQRLPQLTQLH
ncbi:iron-containing alcohol dehydrogenase [Nakamurella aerolata]|uniref:Glycerol dehydrogenase n=1 Tax=Nakamurella aerolata TaxID=1656892 RepID=A0A849AK07_9ACTN|nr:iron-containing alcohol dehydrogenase [Nakamurella aerolata]